ncbi:MAG TPA: DUF1702 family protein, partial [Thermomonospora sp.]|nr:DUF1702 family protein [Thermomonospora sp.]
MPTLTGRLRTRLLTPDRSAVRFDERGFHEHDPDARRTLEHAGTCFLTGFRHAMISRNVTEAAALLETVERPFRGFAYEGAAMAFALTDAMTPWRPHRVRTFLAGPAAAHVYMAHVGIGWG